MAKTRRNNKISLELSIKQRGNIKVHTQIINDLSSGIYSSPASCIKELINNAYDADAREVVIRVKPIEDSITIIDDGNGMNALDFDNNFAWISKSNKRNRSLYSDHLKRPLIGKIGIGFIAVNEICDFLEITSSKRNEKTKFVALINFKEYRENDVNSNGGIIKGEYDLINYEENKSEHYTVIRLLGIKSTVKTILDDHQFKADIIRSKRKDFDKTSFYSMKDILLFHSEKNLKSFTEDNEYLQFIINLASYIPVEYIENGPVEGMKNEVISEILEEHKKLNFKVDLDGIYLKRPIYFQKLNKNEQRIIAFKEEMTVDSELLKFKGYFYIRHGLLIPRELNGVSIKIKNVPIADQFGYDTTFMRYPNYMDQLYQNWISGEIYIEKGLEDAMNIDRKSFRVTHPHYLALQDFLHKYLRQKVFKITQEIYEINKEVKSDKATKLNNLTKKKILNSSKVTIIKRNKKSKTLILSWRPINIKKTTNSTTIEIDEEFINKFKKPEWEIVENIFIIFELAFKESRGNTNKLKELFYKKISTWKS